MSDFKMSKINSFLVVVVAVAAVVVLLLFHASTCKLGSSGIATIKKIFVLKLCHFFTNYLLLTVLIQF
jgi:hypothetical protein